MGEARVNQPMAVELTMLNTIPETLQDCCFIVHGSGLVAGSLEARYRHQAFSPVLKSLGILRIYCMPTWPQHYLLLTMAMGGFMWRLQT